MDKRTLRIRALALALKMEAERGHDVRIGRVSIFFEEAALIADHLIDLTNAQQVTP